MFILSGLLYSYTPPPTFIAVLNWKTFEEYLKANTSSIVPSEVQEHLSGVAAIFIHLSSLFSPISRLPVLYPTILDAPLTTEPTTTGEVITPGV